MAEFIRTHSMPESYGTPDRDQECSEDVFAVIAPGAAAGVLYQEYVTYHPARWGKPIAVRFQKIGTFIPCNCGSGHPHTVCPAADHYCG